MKNRYIIFLIIISGAIQLYAQTESVPQQIDCITKEDFNFVTSYIENNGTEIKSSVKTMPNEEPIIFKTSISKRSVMLEIYQDFKEVIIVDENNIIPKYFLSNKNNEIEISAYYSRLDLDKDVRARNEDWCDIVAILKSMMKNK